MNKSHDCPFCEIITGTQPAFVVYENQLSLAFLDKRPLFAGHTLLIPKEHISTLAELPPHMTGPIFETARKLTIAVEKAMNAQGSFVAINNKVSQSVPHLHIHIVPRTKGDGLKGFFWPRKKYRDDKEMVQVMEKIKSAVANLF